MKKKAQKTETADFNLDVKQLSEDGTFEGWLSVFGNLDHQGDIVQPGAFTKTLQETDSFPLLWHHDQKMPVGSFTAEERKEGLWIRGTLLKDDVRQAKEGYALMKAQVVKGLSIGYRTIRDEIKNGARHLLELALKEGSLVTLPANPLANVVSVKSEGRKDFDEELARRQAFSAPQMMLSALDDALWALVWWSDMDAEEVIASAAETVDQFRGAYLEMLPGLLELIKSDPELEEKLARHELTRAAGAVQKAAARLKSFEAVDTSAPAGDTDSAVATKADAADTSEEEAAAVLLRVAEKLKPGGKAA